MPKRLVGTFVVSILAGITTALIVELFVRPRFPEIEARLATLVAGTNGSSVA